MKGHVKQRGGRFYAVIYEGLDPVTGREVRRWHPAGTDRAAAERLAAKLAKAEKGRSDATRSLTFGAYVVRDWLPAKKLRLAATPTPATSATCSAMCSPPSATSGCGDSPTTRSTRSTTGS